MERMLTIIGIISRCDTGWQFDTAVQSGRPALLRKEPAHALPKAFGPVSDVASTPPAISLSSTISRAGIDEKQRRFSGIAVSRIDFAAQRQRGVRVISDAERTAKLA